jgi:hypothetical protein
MQNDLQIVRHFLAALAYRMHKAVGDAPPDFPNYSAGAGVRTPHALLRHVNGVLHYGLVVLRTGDSNYKGNLESLPWSEEIERFHRQLSEFDEALTGERPVDHELLSRLLQGPLADAMTHAGQLALLRRLAGAPIAAENFYLANIRAGAVSQDQAPPASPDTD